MTDPDRVEEIRRRLQDARLDRELAELTEAAIAADQAVERAKAEREEPAPTRRTT